MTQENGVQCRKLRRIGKGTAPWPDITVTAKMRIGEDIAPIDANELRAMAKVLNFHCD